MNTLKTLLILFSLSVIISCEKDTPSPGSNNSYETSDFPFEYGKDTIWVSNVQELMATATSTKEGNKVVIIKNGEYKLTERLWLTGNNLIYRSESGDRNKVILKGKGMDGDVGFIFSIAGDNFAVKDISIGEVHYHGIQIHGEKDADNLYVQNVRFFDIRQQMIKGSYDRKQPENHADYGVVEGCLFEYTAGKSFYHYCGGVDVHHGENWRISECTFKNIYSPDKDLSEGGVHFWTDSKGTIVENCTFINCDRGIMFGLDNSMHYGGIIRNNMMHITHDVGIYLCFAEGTKVYNNSVYLDSDYGNAIESRFPQTKNCEIINNLTNKKITNREGARAKVENNISNAEAGWFENIGKGNLHLNGIIEGVTDAAIDLEDVETDFDGQPRMAGKSDIGADER